MSDARTELGGTRSSSERRSPPVPLVGITVDRHREFVGRPAMVSAFGYAADDLVGRPIDVLFSERSRSLLHRALDLFQLRGARPWFERCPETLWIERKGGTEIPVRIALSTAGESDLSIFVRDISEEVRKERASLVRAEAVRSLGSASDYRSMLAAAASCATRALGHYAVLEMFAVADAEVCARADAASPARREVARRLEEHWPGSPLAAAARRAIKTGQAAVLTRAKDVDRLGIPELGGRSVMVAPVTADGAVLGAVTVFSPALEEGDLALLTELGGVWGRAIEMAHRLREAESVAHRRAEQVRVVAHELRNVSSAVKLWTAALLKQRALDGVPDGTEALAQSSARLERLVADLWDASGSEARGLSVQPVAGIAPGALVMAAAEAIQPGVREARIVDLAVAPGLPEVRADEDRIRQVLANLIDNALKFSKAPITVGARAGARPGEVLLFVQDRGIGISPADQARVFDLGFQVNSNDRRGWGLGLAICKQIVESHGGKLTVESSVGQGSTFTFGLWAQGGSS
jgi:PAS domain S-box-containing protein